MSAKDKTPSVDQLALFDDPILWWSGEPPRRRKRRGVQGRRPRQPEPPDEPGQMALFDVGADRPRRRRRRKVLRRLDRRLSYLELADALGLISLMRHLNLAGTSFILDARPLKEWLGSETLLDARFRLETYLESAFKDLARQDQETGRVSSLVLWSSREQGWNDAISPQGEVLRLTLCGHPGESLQPFKLRLKGIPGYLAQEPNAAPFEEGEELLSLYHDRAYHALKSADTQPRSLDELVGG